MKKRLLRLSKRILILSLCTCLVSGSVINKYKITANATAVAAALSAYSAYEICLYLGMTLAASCGVAVAIDNRDELAELGKNFVDSMNLDDVSGWVLTKVNTAGQSYVYGSEALQEVKDMAFTVIQGGGNKPENDDDNDGDGDIDSEDRTVELKNLGLWATSSFANLLSEQVQPILNKVQAGEENVISESLGLQDSFTGFKKDENGNYLHSGVQTTYAISDVNGVSAGGLISQNVLINYSSDGTAYYKYPLVAYLDSDNGNLKIYNVASVRNGSLSSANYYVCAYGSDGNITDAYGAVERLFVGDSGPFRYSFNVNFPVFNSRGEAMAAAATNIYVDAVNYAQVYQIADWLQSEWGSTLTQINTGIRSLNDNMLIVGEAMNQALQNQLNGLGYISAIGEGIAGAVPMPLPDIILDPIYYPGDSSIPALTPDEFPWSTPSGSPGTDGSDPSDPDDTTPDEDISDEVIRGTDSFGINTIFGILVLLIMILVMLLILFLSCLAFIVMIFRIEPTTGFLPEEMVQGFEYLKTLQIPGFGMSVYAFFMALLYIILIFTVIGTLRKNIDRLKFPRKGRMN